VDRSVGRTPSPATDAVSLPAASPGPFVATLSPDVVPSGAVVGSGRGVPDLVDASSSPIANSGSNSVGSGPLAGVALSRRGLTAGRRLELDRDSESCAAFCRDCSSGMIAPRIRW
jgi:hypothetical protein